MRSNLAAVSFAISVGFIALYPNPAKAEINLIGSRWSEHEIDFVYCNDGKGPAEIFSITAGEFRPSISKVSPGDCIQRRFFSNEHKHIFHVMRDKEIKVLTFSHSNETLLSDSTVKGALLFLSGFIVSGLQGALGSLISHPIRILRLAYFRRKAVALLKERVDTQKCRWGGSDFAADMACETYRQAMRRLRRLETRKAIEAGNEEPDRGPLKEPDVACLCMAFGPTSARPRGKPFQSSLSRTDTHANERRLADRVDLSWPSVQRGM